MLPDTLYTCSYDLALISGALSEIRDHFNLSEALEEAIVGAAKIGAFFGTFLGISSLQLTVSPSGIDANGIRKSAAS